MKPEITAPAIPTIPVAADEQPVVRKSKIPLAAKVAGTAFLAVLVPVYLHTYGPTNFLWFCDAALILTVAGMWLESSLLISMCAVGILLPQCLWLGGIRNERLGVPSLNPTTYIFRFHPDGCRCCWSGFGCPWARTRGLCLLGLSWPRRWPSSATFFLRPPAPI